MRLVAYRAASECVAKGSMFVVTVLAARRLSQEAFGIFSVASTLGWILAVAADCGIQLHVARAVANRPDTAAAVLWRWLTVRLWTSATMIAAVAAALAIGRPPAAQAGAILLLALTYIAAGLIEFLYYFYRGIGRTDLESSLTLAQRLMILGCATIALVWFPSVITLALALLVPASAVLAVALRLAWRLAAAESKSAADGTGAALADVRSELWNDVLPIGAGIVLSVLYFRIDLFLVDRWLGAAAAGSYNAVFRLVEALRLFPAAVLAVFLPTLFRAGNEQPVVRIATLVTVFGIAVAIVGVFASAELVPLLYGRAYAGAVPAFRVLLLSFPLFCLNYALTHQLIGWNGQRSYLVICGGALVANLGLNAVLIPYQGIAGAAWATFWTELLLTATCARRLWDLAPGRQASVAVAAARI